MIRLSAPEGGDREVLLGADEERILGYYSDAGGFKPSLLERALRAVPCPVDEIDEHARWGAVKAGIAAQLSRRSR